LRPDYVPALQNLVHLREVEQDMIGAMAPLRQLLEQKPDNVEYLQRLATLASRGEDWESAYETYCKLREKHPESLSLFSLWFGARLRLRDWVGYDSLVEELVERNRINLGSEKDSSTSLMDLNAMPAPLDLHTDISRALARSIQRKVVQTPAIVRRQHQKRSGTEVRIGYISPDLRNHAVGRLVHPLFKYHTRPDFRVYGYSLVRTGDKIQKAIRAGCDEFRDLFDVESGRAAQQIQDDDIDVLIDLAGYTTHVRPDILAYRPAPVQCMLMGFPDTMGGDFYDYVLADEWLIPESLAWHYVEKIHYLPHAFFGAATRVPKCRYQRSDFDLAEDAVVFLCNANNAHHKISPAVFDSWMGILSEADKGVLWISTGPEAMQDNLRVRAAQRGIDPARVVFAPRLPWDGYLQRLQLADLALDSFYFNGGSSSIATTSVGVPLLTCAGETNASRMGASICAAAGLETMIATGLEAYRDRAIELATGSGELKDIRMSLASPESLSRFDLKQIAKDMEVAVSELFGRD
jgi:predicted O-linked N-acetylglucosamine transferase (SPINDLY family)